MRRIAELVDSREPQLVAGIVSELRVVNGQRGRVAIFKLDDGSGPSRPVNQRGAAGRNRELLKEDELVIVWARCSPTASPAACA